MTGLVPESGPRRLLKCRWAAAALVGMTALGKDDPARSPSLAHEIRYHNDRKPSGPWSIHVVRVPRQGRQFQFCAAHATGKALGLTPVTAQTSISNSTRGIPVAGINGDFYQREGPYAGDPRGLQITEGELISAPTGGASFCIDLIGEPKAINAVSRLQVTWPDGATSSASPQRPSRA
jgi:hypothetical protein